MVKYFLSGLLCWCISGILHPVSAQRVYSSASVLSSGSWYKISVSAAGVYKIDIPFLNAAGMNTSGLSSASVKIYGNGGNMLSESNNGAWTDDLKEIAIQVVDGGDGLLNGSDYILFYAGGPDRWFKDSANQLFTHEKNIYSDKAFYFLTTGVNAKRITETPLQTSPSVTVSSFSERQFHELDTVNFFGSGKEWYGEEMSGLPGRSFTRNFSVNIPNIVSGASLKLRANCIARSVNAASRFDVRVNNQLAGQMPVNAVSGGQYDLFAQQATGFFTVPAAAINDISFTYVPGGVNAQGWLNWFDIFTRRNLSLNGINQLLFRDWASVGNNRAEFTISDVPAGTRIWDITDPQHPQQVQGVLSGTSYRFINDAMRLREYVAFSTQGFPAPTSEGVVLPQNLHGSTQADMLIITHETLLQQAQRLADLHLQKNNNKVKVVTTAQVYNEFGGGQPDPVALRDLTKMYYDRYGGSTGKLRYLLLFGDASFDYKSRIANNTNLVPAWQNNSSLDPVGSYATDDFFGFLDDNDDINSVSQINLLDIGIGRVPAKNAEEAKNFVDKAYSYYESESFGPWRNNLTFVADDEDGNLHFQDAEIITSTAAATAPVFNLQKIYLDAFRQETSPGGSTYPAAVQASNNQVYNGTLIWNYNGHGGSRRLAEETILDQQLVNNWNNTNRLPLIITATCDFAPYDNPTIASLGENILLRPKTGAIALMTTTRLVFAFSNRIMNNNYIRFALQTDPLTGRYKTLGEAVMEAKNFTYQTLADIPNNRKFTLLGDPAMTIGFPEFRARITKINGLPASQTDTLSAAEKVIAEGEVYDLQGNLLSSFNGNVFPFVYDKPQTINTLANDPGSQAAPFQVQTNAVFKGKSTVTGGRFSFTFLVPKDISFQYGNGKISLYAANTSTDANGYFTGFIVGGSAIDNSGDKEGPEIKAFMNDELFVSGGITNQNPVLLLKLSDSSGINTAGTGIGHDIVATLDNDNNRFFILNDFYQAELNSYQKGTVRFSLTGLEPGPHSLKIKAWDVLNNSGETVIEFVVANDAGLELTHVLNYPNPFTTRTSFWFEHNKPGIPLQVQIHIMTISGRTVKTISRVISTSGNRSEEIEWDGRDDYGDKPGRGVYLYRLKVIAPDGRKKEVLGKLVIL